jgi:hypothetical protein
MGGITLGSVAPSFHSEDEEDQHGWQQQSKGKGREQYAEEESSLLDEEEMAGAGGGDSGTGDEEGYILPSSHQQTRPAVAPSAARPTSNSSRPTSSASRYPSASTQATTAPSPQPRRPLPSSLVDLGHHGSSRLDDSDERDREQSGMLKELNMDESRDSGRWSGVKGANGAGKKKGGGGVGQNMTLREQEKVCSAVLSHSHMLTELLAHLDRSSTSSRRRTLTSSSRSTSTNNVSNASLPTKSTSPSARTFSSKLSFKLSGPSSSGTRSCSSKATEPSRT